jgi:TRAP-type C4-dicarboxylate transport system permease small subunit
MKPDRRNRLASFARFVLFRVPEIILAALVAIVVVFLAGAVFARYVANVGIGWSDEAAELIFAWIVFVGFAVAMRHRANVSVELFVDRLPPSWRRATDIVRDAIILAFSVVFTKESVVTIHFAALQMFPGLQISVAWLYGATLPAGILMTIYAAANFWDTVRGKRPHADALGDGASRHSQ